jgi:hypothetical protein
MEIYMTIGARYLPRGGPLGVAGGIWPKRPLSAPSGALRLRAGLPFDPALISPTRILPVTDRMLVSAEP